MIVQIDKYWEKLFADPIEVETFEGKIIYRRKGRTILLRRGARPEAWIPEKTGNGSLVS